METYGWTSSSSIGTEYGGNATSLSGKRRERRQSSRVDTCRYVRRARDEKDMARRQRYGGKKRVHG